MLKVFNKIRSVKTRVEAGFTLIEVILAAGIMIILCVGTLTVFSHAVIVNRGNNMRSQAQSALQAEAEYYRSLKFLPLGSDTALNAGTYSLPNQPSADGTVFTVAVVITNKALIDGSASTDATATLKEIQITVQPLNAQTGWLASMNTNLTIQRVRSN